MKVLFIQNRPLFPANTGGRIRTLNILRHLAAWHEVTYLCNSQAGDAVHFSKMHELGLRFEAVPRRELKWGSPRFFTTMVRNLASSLPFNVAKHFDPKLRARARLLLAQERYDLIVCDFLQTALHAVDLEGPPRILFQHNVEAQILQRHAETSTGRLRRRYLTMQWQRMVRFEAATGRKFDAVIAVSAQDRTIFERDYGWQHVTSIATSVDTDYFQPGSIPEDHHRVLFLGSMDWLPNREGVKHFIRHVWPLIRKVHPEAVFEIVGRNPSPEILALRSMEGIEVVGTVEDVRPHLSRAGVVVVPLLVGGGTRLKIFEALAMDKAVVSTTIGCEGLPVVAGTHLRVEDTPVAFAQAVCALLSSQEQRRALAAAGRALVCESFGTEPVARQFDAICCKTVYSGEELTPVKNKRDRAQQTSNRHCAVG
jgi:glycosyltransferase involved in cell wall biosynthesis